MEWAKRGCSTSTVLKLHTQAFSSSSLLSSGRRAKPAPSSTTGARGVLPSVEYLGDSTWVFSFFYGLRRLWETLAIFNGYSNSDLIGPYWGTL